MQDLFKPEDYPDLLVGLGQPDDAAIWKLDEQRALVVTTDFFTPVVDDAYDYGQIAAANSLSDIYAMGGLPFLALNVAALPPNLPPELNSEILRGGADKCKEAGVVVAGGHTVQDKEPKFGLVALGFVHPQKYLSKQGARPGDVLILTKPLGFGVTTTALKQEKADAQDVNEVVTWMKRLNRDAGSLAVDLGLRAATDITGYGLLGHGFEVAQASGVCLRIETGKVPFTSGARKYGALWTFPGGASDNQAFFSSHVRFPAGFPEEEQMLLFDPQTSGGLLLAVPSDTEDLFFARARKVDLPAWRIGEVIEGSGIEVV